VNHQPKTAPTHLGWLKKLSKPAKTKCGKKVELWNFNHKDEDAVLSAWAKHFRNHYCRDEEIDVLRNGTGLSRRKYLEDIKFPSNTKPPGPSIRAGDFGEVLVADYLEFILNFWVPRTRYADKTVRDESTKGADTIGFKLVDAGSFSPKDTLSFFEVKAKFTGSKMGTRLKDAVDGSAKDPIRKAESLNSIKQRLLHTGDSDGVITVERFQNPIDNPYVEQFGAAVLVEKKIYDEQEIVDTVASSHPSYSNLSLIVVRGKDMMKLVHSLYERAMDEA
jgi:hypothetical protein